MLFSPDDLGARFYVKLKNDEEYVNGGNHEACKASSNPFPVSGHMQEWFRMMKEGTPAYSNFDVAAYLTEIILLGCIACESARAPAMDWDGPYHAVHQSAGSARFVMRNTGLVGSLTQALSPKARRSTTAFGAHGIARSV